MLLLLFDCCFTKSRTECSFWSGTTLPVMVPIHLEKCRKLCFSPWSKFLQFHRLKTYIEIMNGNWDNFCKDISCSAVSNSHIIPATDTFCSKLGAKTSFWESKVVDEDDADVSKCLTVLENAGFDTYISSGFPKCWFKAFIPYWSNLNFQLQSLHNTWAELIFSTHFEIWYHSG